MKNRFYGWLAPFLVLVLTAGLSATAIGAERTGFTEADQAFYLDEQLFTFIRPGLEFELIDFEIPSDNQPMATFSIKDPGGLPLDREGIFTPGPVDVRFMLTYIPVGEEYKVSYHSRLRDRDGEYTSMGNGVYTYKFSTVLPDDWDMDATHTLGSVATRDLREFSDFGLGRYYDNDVFNFVPSGNGEPMPRDIATTDGCNNCHDPVGEHGGRYQEVQICTQCHNPGLFNDELQLTYDFGPMVHRVHSSNEPQLDPIHYPTMIQDCQLCHTGGTPTADIPLVASPNPISVCSGNGAGMTELNWVADGPVEIRIDSASGKVFTKARTDGAKETGNWVRDGKLFFLVDGASGETLDQQAVNTTVYGCVTNAPYTYTGDVGALHTNWMTRPSRDDCGGCHANIDWVTGEGHAAGPQEDDEFCSFCHEADSGQEFDRSVKGAHTIPLASSDLGGVLVDILGVNNTGPGQRPTVTFTLRNKFGRLSPSELGRLRFVLTGPNEDFDFYVQEDGLGGLVAVGNNWQYTFNTPIPMDAEGSYSVSFEGRINSVVLANGESERDSAETEMVAVAVTDPEPVPRRQIVDDAKCESCHSNLSLHGDNRKNATEYCQTCHAPNETDEAVRLEGEPEGIHFKYMIHKIHRGAELENLPYIVYGYRSSVHDYSEVHYPGDLRNCEACHVEGSYGLPLPEGALPTVSPAAAIPVMGPETATCLSCHDSDAAASHALANTSALGESCTACHGDGKTYSVSRAHAR